MTFLNTSGESGWFERNCMKILNEGNTVTYVALQIAFHLGFRKVALVGCDHNFTSTGPAHKEVIADGDDPNHFDPTYFSGGNKWQLPDLVGSELHYQIADERFREDNGILVNCTEGGKLETLPRMELSEFVNDL